MLPLHHEGHRYFAFVSSNNLNLQRKVVCIGNTLIYYCIAKNWIMKNGKGWWVAMAITVALVYTGFVYTVPWHHGNWWFT